jgi:phospholipid/cholesterol/gamma-HCH transport system substrate-binding protein
VTTEAKVGTFVLVCLSILTATLVSLMTAEFRGGSVPYRTYLRYAGGLEPGASVLFGGIKAGKVVKVQPWESDPTRIEILLELKEGTPLNEKCVAKLGSLSIMSEPALVVSTGSNTAPRLAPGTSIPSQETSSLDDIAGKMTTVADNANGLILQMQGELGNISGDARTLLANLNSVTGQTNQKRIETLLQQANGLLADERPKIDHIADQLLSLTQHADSAIVKAGPVIDHADAAIQTVNATVGDLREPMRKDLAELQNTLNEARNLLGAMQTIVQANDYKIDDTIENLRTATDNLDQLTNSVKERPWSLIRIKQPKDRKVPE